MEGISNPCPQLKNPDPTIRSAYWFQGLTWLTWALHIIIKTRNWWVTRTLDTTYRSMIPRRMSEDTQIPCIRWSGCLAALRKFPMHRQEGMLVTLQCASLQSLIKRVPTNLFLNKRHLAETWHLRPHGMVAQDGKAAYILKENKFPCLNNLPVFCPIWCFVNSMLFSVCEKKTAQCLTRINWKPKSPVWTASLFWSWEF